MFKIEIGFKLSENSLLTFSGDFPGVTKAEAYKAALVALRSKFGTDVVLR